MNYRDPMIQAEHDLRRDAAEVRERHAPLAPLPRVRPILFSAPMIRSLLSGAKTQTRRAFNAYRIRFFHAAAAAGEISDFLDTGILEQNDPSYILDHCPYGQPGDRLWVRETWAPRGVNQIGGGPLKTLIAYRADGAMHTFPHHEIARVVGEWKPSIFMPRWASRITLEITEVRVERLLDISETDAIAEGVRTLPAPQWHPNGWRQTYWQLWDDINGRDAAKANPWTWAITFQRVT